MLSNSFGSGAGSGRYITLLRIENTPVLMPIPSAIGAIAATANPGLRRKVRSTYRTSCDRLDSISGLPFSMRRRNVCGRDDDVAVVHRTVIALEQQRPGVSFRAVERPAG